MVEAQKWLDEKYPKEKRTNVYELHLNESDLTGELDLIDFISLWKISISQSVDESRINFKNKSEGIRIVKLSNAQRWLDENYPKNGRCQNSEDWHNKGSKRKEISYLDIKWQDLEGSFRLEGFDNLKNLFCNDDQFTGLVDAGLENLPEKLENITLKEVNFDSEKNAENYRNWEENKVKKTWSNIEKYFDMWDKYGGFEGTYSETEIYFSVKRWREDNPLDLKTAWKKLSEEREKLSNSEQENWKLKEELQTEREKAEKALQKAQEWRESKLKEINEEKDGEIQQLQARVNELSKQKLANEQPASELIQLKEINDIVLPNRNSFNFTSLKREIKKLKNENLTSQVENKKSEIEQLTNLINQEKFHFKTRQELQNLIQTKQREVRQLGIQLGNLQIQEQTAQILQTNLPSSSQGNNC